MNGDPDVLYDVNPETGIIWAPENKVNLGNVSGSATGNHNNGTIGEREANLQPMEVLSDELEKIDYPIPNPAILNAIPVDLQESLFTAPPIDKKGNAPVLPKCINLHEREYSWFYNVFHNIQEALDENWPLTNHIAAICKAAKIYRCENKECREYRRTIDNILPLCEWPAFREWIIEISACQMRVYPTERLSRPFYHLSAAILAFSWLLEGVKLCKLTNFTARYRNNSGEKVFINIFPVCEIIYWGMTVQIHLGNKKFGYTAWGNTMIPHGIVAPALAEVTRKSRERGICLNRLWSVSLISERGEHDLPAIMELAERYPQLQHKEHGSCTAGFCGFNTVDATRMRQLHMCENNASDHSRQNPGCLENKFFFDPELLRISMEKGGDTVWSINEPFEVLNRDARYITISHVWSDGTGVGIAPPGQVNRCLFDYFAGLVKSLGCDAIWWDSISIPMRPDLRTKCINDMHENYSKSVYTLVHDRYLTNFEWAEDGSPALALIFSPWFTRGWTAVECNMAKKIRVVYRKPGSNEPIIKDLDNEILANDPTRCSRAHWIASNIIRRLRGPVDNVSDLLAILKPRCTSWPRDRMMIAGLLAGIEVNYSMTPREITQRIIKKIKNINHTSLLHSKTTISESGGWSWCPNYIFDLPASPPGEFRRLLPNGRVCIVDSNGTLLGQFPARRVNKEDFRGRRVIPTSTHPFINSRIKAALEEWYNCLLIGHYPGPYILVQTEASNEEYYTRVNYTPSSHHVLACNYIGTVNTAGDEEMYTSDKYDPVVFNPIIIGREPNVVFNFKVLSKFPSQQEFVILGNYSVAPTFKWRFSSNHVWMGDNPTLGDMLVVRRTEVPHPVFGAEYMVTARSLHNLEVREISPGNFSIHVKEEPCFSLTPGGYIDKVSKWWSEDIPTFDYVDILPYWPPITIRSNERAARKNHIRNSRDDANAVPSEILFRLEFLSRTITYAAIDNELAEPSESSPLSGIWACIYPDSRYEFHLFNHLKADDLEITKITSISKEVIRGQRVLQCTGSLLEPKGTALGQIRLQYTSKSQSNQFLSNAILEPEDWAYIGVKLIDIDTIDLYALQGLRNCAGPEYYWKYRRVPKSCLFGGRTDYLS